DAVEPDAVVDISSDDEVIDRVDRAGVLERELDAARERVRQLESERAEQLRGLHDVATEYRRRGELIRSLRDTVSGMSADAATRDERLHELETALSITSADLRNAQAALAGRDERVRRLEAALVDRDDRLRSLESELALLSGKIIELEGGAGV
ncbi:MAG: hypothetical protein KDB40_20640, partial [Acidimicrobiales bacterium]|nr:hypothetical protein [Acidimicrobiales bacterium]